MIDELLVRLVQRYARVTYWPMLPSGSKSSGVIGPGSGPKSMTQLARQEVKDFAIQHQEFVLIQSLHHVFSWRKN